MDTQLREVKGRPVASWQSAAIEDDGSGDRSADRRTLREILMCELDGHVHFGQGFREFAWDTNGRVRIELDDGASPGWFDVLVGADGVNSAVRTRRLPHAVSADTASICMYGKADPLLAIRHGIADELLDGTSVIFADGFTVVIDAMRFPRSVAPAHGRRWGPIKDYLYWALARGR